MQHPVLIRDEGGVLTSSQQVWTVRPHSCCRTFNFWLQLFSQIFLRKCFYLKVLSGVRYFEMSTRCWRYVEDIWHSWHSCFFIGSFSFSVWTTYVYGFPRVLEKRCSLYPPIRNMYRFNRTSGLSNLSKFCRNWSILMSLSPKYMLFLYIYSDVRTTGWYAKYRNYTSRFCC